jgi:hypothetical protein
MDNDVLLVGFQVCALTPNKNVASHSTSLSVSLCII